MAINTLADIQVKVRRITRSPSQAQLTDIQLNNYINTAVLYDFPSNLRLFPLRTNLTFYTQPGVDLYETRVAPTPDTDPLFNFKNKYIAVHQPVFMAGIPAGYTQDRSTFYSQWPQTNSVTDTLLRGDGTTGPWSGVATAHPMLQNNVFFNCLDTSGEAMILKDYPSDNVFGTLNVPNDPSINYGSVNYLTGAFAFSFPNNTMQGATIWVDSIPYQPGKPIMMLYYADQFIIRPVPDNVYSIQIEVDMRPTELLSSTQVPELEQWWQYISLLAAKKIFEDRMDYDSLNLMMPTLKEQERLCLRTTLTQQANERTITIYTTGRYYGLGGWYGASWPY